MPHFPRFRARRAVGIYPLRYFFSRAVGQQGLSRQAVKQRMLLHFKDEDANRPLSDQALCDLLAAEGLLLKNHVDCGCILYDANEQAVKSGGSGAGCCAAVLCTHILPRLERGTQKRVLFLATGALMSQTTFLQKESIPAVAHLVELAAPEKGAAS